MLRLVLLIISLTFISVLKSNSNNSGTYKSAVFTDPDRLEKVKATAATVNEIFKEYSKKHHMPGFVYGIVLDGKLIYSGDFGNSNLEQKIAANNLSMFRIASMSKSFTALAILQLRDSGKLSLDDPVAKYLPEMKKLRYLTTDAPDITIRHLLTHGSGFPEDNPWGDRQLADSDEELMQLVDNGISFSNVPGLSYEYSNLGFALLGQIVQKVSGIKFHEYTMVNIFKPLGMSTTVWEYDKVPKENLALGYNWIDETYVNIPLEHHGSFGAMGGLITSIEDFTKYVALHLSAWPPRSNPDTALLKRSSLREMHYPWRIVDLNTKPGDGKRPYVYAYAYGLGWKKDCDGNVYIGHSGGLPGFGSNWRMMPDYGLAIMSFDNRTYGSTSNINYTVLDTIITLAGLKPRVLPASKILEKRKKELIKFLPDWDGAENSKLFAENFFMDNRLKDLVRQAKNLFEAAGEITTISPLKPMNQLRGTFIMEGEKKNIEIFFTLTPEKVPLIQQVKMNIVDKNE